MLTNLKTQALTRIQFLAFQLASQNLKVSEIEEKSYNYEFSVQSQKETVKVLVYFGKKGVSTIIQGDPESNTYKLVKKTVFGEGLFDSVNNELEEPEEYIGTDESGKGDFFGPLVIASVRIDKRMGNQLKLIGVKDSKEINDNTILKISREIKSIIPEDSKNVVIINPEKYNQLYEKFNNLNKLLAWGHSKAIENIFKNSKPVKVISDKFGNERLLIEELAKKKINIDLIQSTKAERFTAVAAASILAREKMINWFIKYSNELKIDIPKGAGDVVNITAKKIADKFGSELLSKLVKLHFKNYVNFNRT